MCIDFLFSWKGLTQSEPGWTWSKLIILIFGDRGLATTSEFAFCNCLKRIGSGSCVRVCMPDHAWTLYVCTCLHDGMCTCHVCQSRSQAGIPSGFGGPCPHCHCPCTSLTHLSLQESSHDTVMTLSGHWDCSVRFKWCEGTKHHPKPGPLNCKQSCSSPVWHVRCKLPASIDTNPNPRLQSAVLVCGALRSRAPAPRSHCIALRLWNNSTSARCSDKTKQFLMFLVHWLWV